ncbi:13976_t:CDS:2 [Acaulospora colombiana]|uniref:13976_t:CDS:1 n=1 Tax=Acaulospora colombiana TaxID=27376 RepID=A0ACA9JYN3_9GLOM|nr:13976_t:CDS:2 [Acaulospora colombiana]
MEKGKRRDKARLLLNNYRKATTKLVLGHQVTSGSSGVQAFGVTQHQPFWDIGDFEDEIPFPQLLLSPQLEDFRESYKKMNVVHKWILASGKCVEDTLFEYCRRQPVESLLHSWIIDLDDHEVNSLFTTEEWNEIQCAVKILPEVDRTFANSMMRFSDVKTASDLRRVLKTSFLNENEHYDRVKHYDAERAESLTYYEDPNETLQKQHLESWYDINVWSLIIDHGLCNVIGMETVRTEKCSGNHAEKPKEATHASQKVTTEVAKTFDATKLLTDGFKLMKAMHNIFVCLSKQVRF